MDGIGSELDAPRETFESFALEAERSLRRALTVRYGVELGAELTSEALTYAWEHWSDVQQMTNPFGYLFRVAQSRARRYRRWERTLSLPPEEPPPSPDGAMDLSVALKALSPRQRTVVLLVHGYGWSYMETALTLGISVGSVRNQLNRGMGRLRRMLEEDNG